MRGREQQRSEVPHRDGEPLEGESVDVLVDCYGRTQFRCGCGVSRVGGRVRFVGPRDRLVPRVRVEAHVAPKVGDARADAEDGEEVGGGEVPVKVEGFYMLSEEADWPRLDRALEPFEGGQGLVFEGLDAI